MRQILLLGILTLMPAAAVAATKHGEATAHWSSQAACEMATQAKCAQDANKAWHAAETVKNHAAKSAAKPVAEAAKIVAPAVPVMTAPEPAPVPPSSVSAPAQPPVTAEPPQEKEGFFNKLFGGKKAQAPSPLPPVMHKPAAADAPQPQAQPLPKPPELERQPVDPEAVLRGKVWASESACKKEALKGKCSSIDCATHSGGACSGYTSMIWIYR